MTDHTPRHADTAAARIRNAHARETHPSQTRAPWLLSELNRTTTPNPPTQADAMIVRITYLAEDRVSPDRTQDYYSVFTADDNSLQDAQYISSHDDVFGVAIYTVKAAENPDSKPIAIYQDGKGIIL